MQGTQSVRAAIGALALASVVTACADSAGGPFHRPDVAVDRIVAPAIMALAADGRLGVSGSVGVLDHLDPSAILGNDELPAAIEDGIDASNWAPPTDALSESVRATLEAALPGRDVGFFALDGAPLPPDDPSCATPEHEQIFVRLALVQGQAVHGDVFVVIAGVHDFCGNAQWSAARVIWQPGGLVGGDWVVGGGIIPVLEPDVSPEVLVELAVTRLVEDGRLDGQQLLVLDQLDAATMLAGERLPAAIVEAIQPATEAPRPAPLPVNARDAIQKYGGGREVEFVPAEPQVVAVNETGCGQLERGASFVRLAMVPGRGAITPTVLVIAEVWDGCATAWAAVRLEWADGKWVQSIIDGGPVSA